MYSFIANTFFYILMALVIYAIYKTIKDGRSQNTDNDEVTHVNCAEIERKSKPMTTEVELKPCPFCGGEAMLSKPEPPCRYWSVDCECYASGPLEGTAEEAAAKWNTRRYAPPSPEWLEKNTSTMEDVFNA